MPIKYEIGADRVATLPFPAPRPQVHPLTHAVPPRPQHRRDN